MKKKFALLLVFVFSLLAVLTGCNLFDNNNYAALSSKVATNGDITITREDLINGYNNGGYYYSSAYGLTQEESFKRIIDELINEAYYNKYIESESTKNDLYKLNAQEYSDVVSKTWDYIGQGMSSYITEVRDVFGLSNSDISLNDDSSDPEFKPQSQYETKFELLEDGKIAYIMPDDDEEHKLNVSTLTSDELALSYAQEKYSYERQIYSTNSDYKKLVWKKYIAGLKRAQSNYKYDDLTDTAVFNREVKRIFEIVLKGEKQDKFKEQMTLSANFDYDTTTGRYILNNKTINKMLDYYASVYTKNTAIYNASKDAFYADVAGTTNRGNYVYFGDSKDQTLITCSHILIKLSDDQKSEISNIESNNLYQGSQKDDIINQIKSANNTYAYERDLTTGEVIDKDGISVSKLYEDLSNDIDKVSGIEDITKVFNNYLYKYNVDTGIINAQFDYVVGTKTSSMVESFTNAVRELYNDGKGQVGSIKMVYEENSNYSGYHIILYTGTLNNLFDSNADLNKLNASNIYSLLASQYTSLSYNETMFEFIYDKVATDSFSTYKTELIASCINGKTTEYVTSNYSDLYSN